MWRALVIAIILLGSAELLPSQTQQMPQTARQALIEMFFGKSLDSVEKHLPEATKAAIRKADPNSAAGMLQQLSTLTGQLKANGQQVQTFDVGPTLLSLEDARTSTKFEVIVDGDDLRGDEDEIDLSFRAYKDGQTQGLQVSPRLTLTMKQEKQVWRLNEVMISIRWSLTDPEFLKAISTPRTPSAAAASTSPTQAAAVGAMRTIMAAELTYASSYPTRGYTCSLSDLDGFGADQPNEHQAMLIDTRLASGKKFGYVFSFSSCQPAPTNVFRLTAVPATGPGTGRSFCSSQDGLIHYADDGTAASCWASGKPLQ